MPPLLDDIGEYFPLNARIGHLLIRKTERFLRFTH